MDPKDELLAKLKAIDAEANPPAPEPELKPVTPPASTPKAEAAPKISTDDFLAKLEALDEATRPAPPPLPKTVIPPPLTPRPSNSRPPTAAPTTTGNPPTAPSTPPGSKPPPTFPSSGHPSATPSQLPWQPFAEAFGQLKRYTQAQIAARAAETAARQKREAEIARAQTWLEELDPLSDDGFWFEQFAESYESRIQAALDFLNPGRSK